MEQQNTTNTNDNNMDAQLNEYTELVTEALQQGASLKDLEGIPNELMDGVYRFAYNFYQQGKLEEAETFFRFLCLYDFNNSDYIMGLAAVKQLQKQYETALDLYALAYVHGDNDYRPMFYGGQCNLIIGEKEKAKYCFQKVYQHANDQELKHRAQAYIEFLASSLANDDKQG
ncbi:type III secretion system translocator chaperone SicA [Candidatus Arsenophonus nilaparvatae]|uniref:type III secretion system translocator chaperone SicA n=1 Tax=Candidatus Arsenophonus nilaparvatae TaxID=1247023 RepID=UPI000A5B454E|nr:type III secretion system translocator chaperone SicA [Candidatus Arsenophonus nilaparvatae]